MIRVFHWFGYISSELDLNFKIIIADGSTTQRYSTDFIILHIAQSCEIYVEFNFGGANTFNTYNI